MKKSRFTETQIVSILKETETDLALENRALKDLIEKKALGRLDKRGVIVKSCVWLSAQAACCSSTCIPSWNSMPFITSVPRPRTNNPSTEP